MIIEKDIALPETERGKWVKLTRDMEVGDSLKVPNQNVSSIITAMKSNSFQPTTRKLDSEHSRIWRAA